MKRLEILGWWCNEAARTGLPRPQWLVSPMPVPQRTMLLAYLRAGTTLVRYPEASFCRFACSEQVMGRIDQTDGTFVWPDGLAHYLERHDVRLPDHFTNHVAATGGVIVPFVLPKVRFGLFDVAPWLSWARAQRACLDVEGWDVPSHDVLARIVADLGGVPHEAVLLCRGATREVVLATGGGTLQVHQLCADGRAPVRLAGWHEWPIADVLGSESGGGR